MILKTYNEEIACTKIENGPDYISAFDDDVVIFWAGGISDFSMYSLEGDDGKPLEFFKG